jgi:hypothetical protein
MGSCEVIAGAEAGFSDPERACWVYRRAFSGVNLNSRTRIGEGQVRTFLGRSDLIRADWHLRFEELRATLAAVWSSDQEENSESISADEPGLASGEGDKRWDSASETVIGSRLLPRLVRSSQEVRYLFSYGLSADPCSEDCVSILLE